MNGTFRTNDVVKYSNPIPGEEDMTFRVYEYLGERVIIESRDFEQYRIKPQETVLPIDIELVRRPCPACASAVPARDGSLEFDATCEKFTPVLTLTNGYVTEDSRVELRKVADGAWTCNHCEHCE